MPRIAHTPQRRYCWDTMSPDDPSDAKVWNGQPTFRVKNPVMTQDWLTLSAVHWRVEPPIAQARLPEGLQIDIFDESAWVGLIPFQMADIAAGRGPAIPYFGTFPETTVRTYVTGPAGPGIWFDSLDITRLVPVLTAWATYRLPYIWSRMSISRDGSSIEYRARRRWPGPRGTKSHVKIEIGDRITQPSQLEHFLSARWGLYTMLRGKLSFADVEHEPWPLHEATPIEIDDQLLTAAGYPLGGVPDHVMYSPGVSVRIGRPRAVN